MTSDERRVQALLRPRSGLVDVSPSCCPIGAETGVGGHQAPDQTVELTRRLSESPRGAASRTFPRGALAAVGAWLVRVLSPPELRHKDTR